MIYQIFLNPKQKGETNSEPSTSSYFVTMSGRSFRKDVIRQPLSYQRITIYRTTQYT